MAVNRRDPLEQLFVTYPLTVQSTPTPLNANVDLEAYVQSFNISNPSVNTASVFWGDGQVTASTAGNVGSGLEILTGTTQAFIIRQERQFYEIQDPDILSAQKLVCEPIPMIMIPVIVWNPQNFYLIATAAAAPVTVSVAMFRSVYI